MQGLDSLDDHGELAEWPRKPQVSTRQHVSWALARPPIARRLAVTPAGAHAPHPYGLQLERLHRWDEAADVLREASGHKGQNIGVCPYARMLLLVALYQAGRYPEMPLRPAKISGTSR